MSPELQTYAALAIVALAAAGLVWSAWKKRRRPGCGSAGEGCGCPAPGARGLTEALKRRPSPPPSPAGRPPAR